MGEDSLWLSNWKVIVRIFIWWVSYGKDLDTYRATYRCLWLVFILSVSIPGPIGWGVPFARWRIVGVPRKYARNISIHLSPKHGQKSYWTDECLNQKTACARIEIRKSRCRSKKHCQEDNYVHHKIRVLLLHLALTGHPCLGEKNLCRLVFSYMTLVY